MYTGSNVRPMIDHEQVCVHFAWSIAQVQVNGGGVIPQPRSPDYRTVQKQVCAKEVVG